MVDISCYKNPSMLQSMMISELQNAQSDEGYAERFRGRPLRFVIPLITGRENIAKGQNLVDLEYTRASAFLVGKREVRLCPEQICDVGCVTPTINYGLSNGRRYRYFYAISADVDDPVSAGKILKVDTETGEVKEWHEKNLYCSEPMFVPSPKSQREDEGILLTSAIRGRTDTNYTALIVLVKQAQSLLLDY